MVDTGSSLIPAQLDYKRLDYAGPKYKFSRVVPLSGSQTVTIPVASTAETLMEIPTNVFNFAESYLYANVLYPLTAARYSWVYTDGMPLISEVDLYTRSGVYLCQLPNFQNYMKIVRKMYTPWKEFESNDQSNFLYMSDVAVNQPPAITPNNGNASIPNTEPAYVLNNASLGLAIATDINLTMNIPLSAIKKTIFALNKDIVFPDIIVLRILWGPSNKAFFISTNGADPTLGAPAASATQIVVSNLTLYLATEKNEDLAQSVRSLVNSPSGMNILIDYPYSYKQNLSGTSQNISLRFNRGHGKNLLSVVSSPFNATESANTAYDCFNMTSASSAAWNAASAKITSYYSQLDNVRLQDINLTCINSANDDWRENKKFLKDSPVSDVSVYQNNWFHQDKFYEDNPTDVTPKENLDCGMSLVVERKYDLLATMAGATAFNWYTHALVQKDLHIGSNMIQFI